MREVTAITYTLIALLLASLLLHMYTLRLVWVDVIETQSHRFEDIQDTLRFRYKTDTYSRTDYAWHFNSGQKLDQLIEDVDKIKNELGLVENYTYAGPHQH